MNDDRFEFSKLELPQVWLNFDLGAGGAFKNRSGKMVLPPGHSMASKFPDKVASADEMKAREAKQSAEKVAAGADFASVIDRNVDALSTSMSKSDIEKLRKLNEKSTPEELDDVLSALGGVDERTFGLYINASRSTTGQLPPMWNEHFRRLQKISGMDNEDKVRQAVEQSISAAKADAKGLGANKDITAAMGKDPLANGLLKQDPKKYIDRQRQLYERDFENIANRVANIRIAQIKKANAAQEREFARERAREAKAPKPTQNFDDFNVEDMQKFFS